MKKTSLFVLVLLVFTGLKGQDSESVLISTKKIADKIIRETSFNYTPQTITSNGGWSQFSFPQIHENEEYYAYSILVSEEEFNGQLGLCFTGNIRVTLNGEEIFNGKSNALEISEYTYSRYHIQKILPAGFKKGKNEIFISCAEVKGETRVMLMPVNKLNEKEKKVSVEPILIGLSTTDWLISGPYSLKNKPENLSGMLSGKMFSEAKGDHLKSWNIPSQPVIRRLHIEETNSFSRDSYADWNYANGGTMLGVLNVYKVSGDKNYLEFVQKYADNILVNREYFQWQYQHLHVLRGSFYRLFRLIMLDDSGGPALPFAELERMQSGGDYTDLLDRVLEYVSKGQERLPDQTLCRPEPEANTIWADDLFMATPFLCRMALLTGDPSIFDDVAKQVIQFNHYLQDDKTGLYFHGWYDDRKETTPVRWGRANGWITWAMSEILLLMPEDHKDYKKIQKIFTNHIKAIAEYQGENGMWHQVLDHPETYEETSCTAMFTLALSRGVRMGWLKETYRQQAINGWRALETKIGEDGTVVGICRGTEIGNSVEFYNARQTFDHDPRGLGAMLTAGSEVSLLLQSSSEAGSE